MLEKKEGIEMAKEIGKVKHVGTMLEFCEKMIEKGSTRTLEEIKGRSAENLSVFSKYEGEIGEDVESWVEFMNPFAIQGESETTVFSIETQNYTVEEVNQAMYQAYKYLEKLDTGNGKMFFSYLEVLKEQKGTIGEMADKSKKDFIIRKMDSINKENKNDVYALAMSSPHTEKLVSNSLISVTELMDINTMVKLKETVYPLYDELELMYGTDKLENHLEYVASKKVSHENSSVSKYLQKCASDYLDRGKVDR